MKKKRYIPYGYTVRNGHTVVENGEAAVIREIFRHYLDGASLQEIATVLTKRKVPYTERSSVWNKANISRILSNAKYIGSSGYEPIIEPQLFHASAEEKTARQNHTSNQGRTELTFLRNKVRCEACGALMVRKIHPSSRIRECWHCTNEQCGVMIHIRDADLLGAATVLMNRVIANTDLLLPGKKQRDDLPAVQTLQKQINEELLSDNPSEAWILEKVGEIANEMYRGSETGRDVMAQIARKKAMRMQAQESFHEAYFRELVSHITLGAGGTVTLHTKTGTKIW